MQKYILPCFDRAVFSGTVQQQVFAQPAQLTGTAEQMVE